MAAKLHILALLPLAALAACGDDPAPQQGDGRSASGEVFEGTISDAMIPLDELRSQPPLAKPSASDSSSGSASDRADEEGEGEDAADETEAAAAPAPAPAASPAAPAGE